MKGRNPTKVEQYHMDKVHRNYDNLINILGADHTGYLKRIKAAVSALSDNKTL